jgi:hypothetical protein
MALVEDGFLVGEIVVEGRVPHAEPPRDVVERRGVVAAFAEGAKGRAEDLFPAALALRAHARGSDGGGDGRSHGLFPGVEPDVEL